MDVCVCMDVCVYMYVFMYTHCGVQVKGLGFAKSFKPMSLCMYPYVLCILMY
jgi:hypothetical protein